SSTLRWLLGKWDSVARVISPPLSFVGWVAHPRRFAACTSRSFQSCEGPHRVLRRMLRNWQCYSAEAAHPDIRRSPTQDDCSHLRCLNALDVSFTPTHGVSGTASARWRRERRHALPR